MKLYDSGTCFLVLKIRMGFDWAAAFYSPPVLTLGKIDDNDELHTGLGEMRKAVSCVVGQIDSTAVCI